MGFLSEILHCIRTGTEGENDRGIEVAGREKGIEETRVVKKLRITANTLEDRSRIQKALDRLETWARDNIIKVQYRQCKSNIPREEQPNAHTQNGRKVAWLGSSTPRNIWEFWWVTDSRCVNSVMQPQKKQM